LKDNFLDVKVRYIEDILQEQKTLFKAFGIVDKQLYDNHRAGNDTTSFKIRTARVERNVEAALIARGSKIPKELHAAKKKRDKDSGSSWKS
jgi:TRIAD3 protein (E3 ubiquitin-protein ligase RNF216)